MSYEKYNQYTGKGRKAYQSDIGKSANITNDINRWRNNSRRYDYQGIDTESVPKKYIKRSDVKQRTKVHNWRYYRRYWY